jgi:hypothetical protein
MGRILDFYWHRICHGQFCGVQIDKTPNRKEKIMNMKWRKAIHNTRSKSETRIVYGLMYNQLFSLPENVFMAFTISEAWYMYGDIADILEAGSWWPITRKDFNALCNRVGEIPEAFDTVFDYVDMGIEYEVVPYSIPYEISICKTTYKKAKMLGWE